MRSARRWAYGTIEDNAKRKPSISVRGCHPQPVVCWKFRLRLDAKEPKHSPLANIAAEEKDASTASTSNLIDQVTCRRDGREQKLSGRVLIEASDGGMLLQSDGGRDLDHRRQGRTSSTSTLTSPSPQRVPKKSASDCLPGHRPTFRVYTTPHYVVCYGQPRANMLNGQARCSSGFTRRSPTIGSIKSLSSTSPSSRSFACCLPIDRRMSRRQKRK